LAKPVPIYPAEGSVLDNVADFHAHHQRVTEQIQRHQLGLPKGAPLPGKPENVPFPRMVYRVEYFSAPDNSERAKHYREAANEREVKDAQGEGFFASLQEAKDAFEAQQKKDEKKK
jgi:hypothetical protein